MTLPVLVANHKKKEIPVRLQKFYSTFNNALQMSQVYNGDMTSWEFQNTDTVGGTANVGQFNDKFFNKYLISYMKGIEKCSPKDTKCNFELDSAVNAEKGANYSRFVFADGSCFGVLIGWSNPNTAKVHGWFDYNCKAKPNKAGKDEFSFYMSFGVTSNHYTPFQYTNYYSNGKKLSDMSRNELKQLCISEPVNCGALIQYDGWRVADDYPVKL